MQIISQLINYNSPCYDDDDDENVGEEDDATKSSSPSPFELVKSKEKDKKLKLVRFLVFVVDSPVSVLFKVLICWFH